MSLLLLFHPQGTAGPAPPPSSPQRGDWQIFFGDDKKRRQRWQQETLDREALRAIIRAAVLKEIPAVAEYVEYEAPKKPSKKPSDTGKVHKALTPSRAMPFIDYDAIMEDMLALQRIVSWHYQQQVEIARMDDDDDAIIALIM